MAKSDVMIEVTAFRRVFYIFSELPKYIPMKNRENFLSVMGYILPKDESVLYTMKSPGDNFFGIPLPRNPRNAEIKFH